MDRARASGYIPPNVQEPLYKGYLERRRSDHERRLDAIQCRKPRYRDHDLTPKLELARGDGMIVHSKKIFVGKETEFRNTFANRELLQRISAIKAAPPNNKYTDRDYKIMKKTFIPLSKTYRDVHRQYLQVTKLKVDQEKRKAVAPVIDFRKYKDDYNQQVRCI